MPRAEGNAAAGIAGRAIALLGSAAVLVAAFLPWTGDGDLALDLRVFGLDRAAEQPTVGLLLVLLAAVGAVTAAVGDTGWPRGLAALGVGGLVLAWLAGGPDGTISAGVAAALGGAALLLVGAALALGDEPAVAAEPAAEVAPPAGHRSLTGPGELVVEAWGPTRAACFAEAVVGVGAGSAVVDGAPSIGVVDIDVEAGPDADVLERLVSDILASFEHHHVAPVQVTLREAFHGGVAGHMSVARVGGVAPLGPAPRIAAYERVAVEQDATGWRCRVTLAS